jgi:hypothetical protein
MKKFFCKTTSFIALLAIVLLVAFLLNKYFANFSIESEKSIVILGDSKSECTFNDTFIDEVANFSVLGESYFYSFFKIKKLIEQNSQVKIVFVEISNSQTNANIDRRIWGEKYMPFKFPLYSPLMDLESIQVLQSQNSHVFNSSLISVIKSNFKMLACGLNYTVETKGYNILERKLTDSIIDRIEINKEVYEIDNKISEITDFKYLHKIISYCESKDVKVYLVRSPLHKRYYGFVNESHFQNLIKNEFSKVEFLDFSRFPLSTDKYADLNHLNKYGSEIFSKWFDISLKEGLLEKKDKQLFIDESIRKIKLKKPTEQLSN